MAEADRKQNIVIGGAAGAVPVLVGWAAVTDSLAWTPVVLFAVIFMWTPPHFWALAFKYKDDYEAAHVPMLPVGGHLPPDGRRDLRLHRDDGGHIPGAGSGGPLGCLYVVSAAVPRGGLPRSWPSGLWRRATPKAAMQLFSYSITYLTLLFVVMAVDVFVQHR